MTELFPKHLDVHTFHLSDFKNPYDAFYWLGFFSAVPRADRSAAHAHKREVSRNDTCKKKQPLCEVAEFLVFDTETSGLSRTDCAVQVALGFFGADGRALGFYDRLWKLPKGVKICHGSYKIHGISNRKLQESGHETPPEVRKVLNIIRVMRERGKRIVAHNAAFDCRMLAQTARHHGVEGWNLECDDVFCTMKASKAHCGLTSKKTGRPKAPSNSELFKHLTGAPPTGALHDALVDLRVTARSYVEGQKLGWW